MATSSFKDHFSTQSTQYQRYRPHYPANLFEWLATQTPQHTLAWDCATGSGQSARALAKHFARVIATDASAQQVAQCKVHAGVEYRVAPAEHAPLADASVALVTVAQALHWFDQAAFFNEAWRVLTNDGIIAVWNYNLLSISPQIDAIVNHFYNDIVGPYWPAERQLIEQGYPPLPTPFTEISAPVFAMTTKWTLDELTGYLGTWSASKYYVDTESKDPLLLIRDELKQAWGNENQHYNVNWPLQLRIGIKHLTI